MQLCALFRLAFASAPDLQSLTSLHNVTRRSVLQKVRDRTFNVLSLLVNTGFQVLFHSPPGVLFTFPSQYYAPVSYTHLDVYKRQITHSLNVWLLLSQHPSCL